MKLEYLEEFLMLAETGSYSATAESMFISVSTLSRHIILLEEELGVELFVRGARNVSVSKAGMLLLPYAETISNAKSELSKVLATECGHVQQTISIGFTRAIIQYGILEKLMQFREENPDIIVLMNESAPANVLQMLKNGECNFIMSFKYVFYDGGDLQNLPLEKDTVSVAVPVSHPLAARKSVTLQDIKDELFVFHGRSSPAYKQQLQMFQEAGLKPKVLTNVESARFMLELVSYGSGICMVEQKRFASSLPKNVKLVPLKPQVNRTLALTYKKHELSEAESRFLEFVKSEIVCV